MHILASADPRTGGPVEGAVRFGELWAQQGHIQDLLTLDGPDELYSTDYPGRVFALGPSRRRTPLALYRYSPKMVPWLRRNAKEYDAVIVAGLWRYTTIGVRRALFDAGVPYFVYTHGMLDPWFRRTYPLKHALKQISWLIGEGPMLRNARGVLFTTADEESLACNAFWPYGVNGIVVGYGTSDVRGKANDQVAAFRGAFPRLGGRRYLLFLSRLHPKKGCDLLVEAFASIAQSEPDLDLVIAGPDQSGLRAKLQSQALRLAIAHRIHFTGMISDEIKWGSLHGCEAFVLTSHQENFGVAVAEAMACGRPVLISNKVNIWREVQSDGAGMVENDTVEGAKRLFARFFALSESERGALGVRARTCFLNRFQVESAAQTLLNVIRNSIGKYETS